MEEINFDTLLNGVGGFGRYQISLWLSCTVFIELFMSQNQLFMIIAGAQPEWSCGSNNSTEYPTNNSTLSEENKCDTYHSCPNIVYQEPLKSVATEYGLYCGYSSVVEIMMAVQMCGVLFGAAFWSQMAACYGRKWVLFAIVSSELSICVAMAFSPCWQAFMLLMFFCGFSVGGYWTVDYVFVQEQIITKWRVFASAVTGWTIGMLVFPLIFWYFQNWRTVLLVVNVTGFLSLGSFIWTQESPRWLIEQGRIDQAYEALSYIAKVNRKPLPDKSQIELLHNRSTENSSRRSNYRHLFATRSLTIKVVALATSWFVVSCVSYALSFNVKNLPGNRYVNALLMGAVESVSGWLVPLWNKCCGRRWLHQMSLITMAACMLIVVLAILYKTTLGSTGDLLVTVFAIAGVGVAAPSWQVVYLYSVEMFSTGLRPLSNGVGSCAARIGGTIAPLILILGKTWTVLPYLVFLVFCFVNLLLSCTVLPETRGMVLPEGFPVTKDRRRTSTYDPGRKDDGQKSPLSLQLEETNVMT